MSTLPTSPSPEFLRAVPPDVALAALREKLPTRLPASPADEEAALKAALATPDYRREEHVWESTFTAYRLVSFHMHHRPHPDGDHSPYDPYTTEDAPGLPRQARAMLPEGISILPSMTDPDAAFRTLKFYAYIADHMKIMEHPIGQTGLDILFEGETLYAARSWPSMETIAEVDASLTSIAVEETTHRSSTAARKKLAKLGLGRYELEPIVQRARQELKAMYPTDDPTTMRATLIAQAQSVAAEASEIGDLKSRLSAINLSAKLAGLYDTTKNENQFDAFIKVINGGVPGGTNFIEHDDLPPPPDEDFGLEEGYDG